MEDRCPICGAEKERAGGRVGCSVCGFPVAFVKAFAGKKAIEEQERRVEAEKRQMQINKRLKIAADQLFSSDSLTSFRFPDGIMASVASSGMVSRSSDVIKRCVGERITVCLLKSGKVTVTGNDNRYQQNEANAWEKIRDIAVLPNGIYGVTEEGKVSVASSLVSAEVLQWENIIALAADNNYILGLSGTGEVFAAGIGLSDEIIKQIHSWTHVRKIAAGAGCCAALHNDGTVSFAGRAHDRRKPEHWQDVADIAIDHFYLIGVRQNGSLIYAGQSHENLDLGRKELIQSTRPVLGVSCTGSVIALIEETGDLHMAGNLKDSPENLIEAWNREVAPLIRTLVYKKEIDNDKKPSDVENHYEGFLIREVTEGIEKFS